MFSKALYKQSWKANGIMWGTVTATLCMMLAFVMLITGSGSLTESKAAFQDTFIMETLDSQIKEQAVANYAIVDQTMMSFDHNFVRSVRTEYMVEFDNTTPYVASADNWLLEMPKRTDYANDEEYEAAVLAWQQSSPTPENKASEYYLNFLNLWLLEAPKEDDFATPEAYQAALLLWQEQKPVASETAFMALALEEERMTEVYEGALDLTILDLQAFCLEIDESYDKESDYYVQAHVAFMFVLNPNGIASNLYERYEVGSTPSEYDVAGLMNAITVNDRLQWVGEKEGEDIQAYLTSKERNNYRESRGCHCIPILIAGSMMDPVNRRAVLIALADYNISEERFDSFGYTYAKCKSLGETAIVTYQARLAFELDRMNPGDYESEEAYQTAVLDMKQALISDITNTIMQKLPETISDAMSELGQMDIYGVIVGSIFYKSAGLLLPIIYMILTANNLIAGQVDTGSMAYVLSTSTKRSQVVLTQALYLVSSLLMMFIATTITSFICFAFVDKTGTNLNYVKLLWMNIGAFMVLFALSGLNYLTSCWFDRSKQSMSIGGGLSMFFLVATILGLFGTRIIPEVIRMKPLNFFNYVTIISLFDTIQIVDGNHAFIYKLAILLVIGVIFYIVGAWRFKRKDLPL